MYALALALLVIAPLLKPGYLLLRDAVSTPRSYLSDAALGLTSAPRALPQDFAVALASHVLDGGIVVKALLVLGLWLAGWGAARLVATVLPGGGAAGQFVADHAGDLESLCGRTTFAGSLEPAGRLRLPAVGCDGDAGAADCGRVRLAGSSALALLDGAGRVDPDRAVAGRDGGAGLRGGARCRTAALAVRGGCSSPRWWRRCRG